MHKQDRHFFVVALFFLYPRLFEDKISLLASSYWFAAVIYHYHSLISFILYMIGTHLAQNNRLHAVRVLA